MKVDYYLPMSRLPESATHAGLAARRGFDGLFSADASHEPFLPLVAAAAVAPGLELGTAIAVAFARSPMTVAYAAWDLADLTGGRFLLGLGTQVRAHITRRFGMPWSSPGPRMREYIAALRTIWSAWDEGTSVRFRGDHYQFTLMTPFFSPGSLDGLRVPVYIAGVGEYMCRLAGEVCDGFHVHPFHTRRYLEEVILTNMAEGAAAAGRSVSDVDRASSIMVATGRDDDELAEAADALRLQIAFYASTPAYRPVLDLHGWDVGEALTAMSKRGRWAEMGAVITDDILNEVAIVAPLEEVGDRVRERYDGLLDRVGFYPSCAPNLDDEGWGALVETLHG